MTDGWNEHRLEVLRKIDELTDAVAASEKRHVEIVGLVEKMAENLETHMAREELENKKREELLGRAVNVVERFLDQHQDHRKWQADLESLEARVGQLEARNRI